MADLQKVIKVTQAQYNTLANGGTIGDYTGLNNNYIYLVTDHNNYIAAPFLSVANKILLSTTTEGDAVWSSSALNTSTTKPLYLTSSGVLSAANTYAGGTAVTLNGSSKSADTASFYAPTSYGTTSQYLKGGGSGATPTWQTLYAPTTVGSSGQVWRSNGSTPSWTTVYIPTTTGTAGQLWRSNGSGGAWYTVFSYSNGVLTITNT